MGFIGRTAYFLMNEQKRFMKQHGVEVNNVDNLLNDEKDKEMILNYAKNRKTRFSINEIAQTIGISRAVALTEQLINDGLIVKDSSGMLKIKPHDMND